MTPDFSDLTSKDPGFLGDMGGPEPAKTGFRNRKLQIAALLAVVMLAEAGVMYFLIPAPANADAGTDAGAELAGDESAGLAVESVEVEIGSFSVTNSRATDGSIWHIGFNLYAVVPRAKQQEFIHAANDVHKARVRQAVVQVARSSNLDDLSDPGLNTIKRLLKEVINKVLQKSYITEVVISEFKTIEQ